MIWEPLMIKCTCCCGWLASSLYLCLLESTKCENTTWNSLTCSLLGVAYFLDQPFWLLQLKHLKYPLDYHFHVSLPSTILGLPTKGDKPLHIGRSDLSLKNNSWHSLEISWLIDPSEWLNLMSNLESFFKSFCFYLMIFNCH